MVAKTVLIVFTFAFAALISASPLEKVNQYHNLQLLSLTKASREQSLSSLIQDQRALHLQLQPLKFCMILFTSELGLVLTKF
jgi:hypothetical protein